MPLFRCASKWIKFLFLGLGLGPLKVEAPPMVVSFTNPLAAAYQVRRGTCLHRWQNNPPGSFKGKLWCLLSIRMPMIRCTHAK